MSKSGEGDVEWANRLISLIQNNKMYAKVIPTEIVINETVMSSIPVGWSDVDTVMQIQTPPATNPELLKYHYWVEKIIRGLDGSGKSSYQLRFQISKLR
jgi:hypothetical protein